MTTGSTAKTLASMRTDLASTLRRSAVLVRVKRRVERHIRGKDNAQILESLTAFAPYSAGSMERRATMALEAVPATVSLLATLSKQAGKGSLRELDITSLCATPVQTSSAQTLKMLFDKYGSDKASPHDYHLLYGYILRDPASVAAVLEIGLGTNNPDVVSHMGRDGKPGASLRALRDYLPQATVYGADVDRRILFSDDRIQTTHVDQTDPESFTELAMLVGHELDLIIDDGLHSPNANLAVLLFAIERLRVGGWLVIEDVAPTAVEIWRTVAALLPPNYDSLLLRAEGAMIFASTRVS